MTATDGSLIATTTYAAGAGGPTYVRVNNEGSSQRAFKVVSTSDRRHGVYVWTEGAASGWSEVGGFYPPEAPTAEQAAILAWKVIH